MCWGAPGGALSLYPPHPTPTTCVQRHLGPRCPLSQDKVSSHPLSSNPGQSSYLGGGEWKAPRPSLVLGGQE